MHPTRLTALTLLIALLALPTTAVAQDGDGLIAFENTIDVEEGIARIELMAPDGSDRRVLVDEGYDPALSPDGTAVAFRVDGDIHLADVATGAVTQVTSSPSSEASPAWSPTGGLLAFNRVAPSGADCSHLINSEIVVTDFSSEVQITDSPCLAESDPDFSPHGDAIAYTALSRNADFSGAASVIVVQELESGESTLVTGADEDLAFHPSWSPDGTTIAYDGLFDVFTIPSSGGESTQITDTSTADFSVLAPDWSPDGSRLVVTVSSADEDDLAVIPSDGGDLERITDADGQEGKASWAGTATPAGPGGPTPDEPAITLVDGARIDGGGATDPVGQTIATSQAAFADGTADLVVLATADRFPDALAGAALAGEHGPILVTPFADTLDPRVAAEITRVTGGTGIALVLGGTTAVTEPAAQQARDAAGTPTCPSPYPTDCRYAGTGREHTAALIAQTVLDRDGNHATVLLARGDAFADAITGGAYAAETATPILLTPSTQLNDSTRAVITDNGITDVIVLGGTAAIEDATVAAVPATTRRIAGSDRTATAAAVATDLWHAQGLDGGGIVLINARHDTGWQTALAAAVVSALANAPQLALENPPAAPGQTVLDAAATLGGPVTAYGDPTLISDTQLAAVRDAAGG